MSKKCNHDVFDKNNTLYIQPESTHTSEYSKDEWVDIECKICKKEITYDSKGEVYA